MKKSDKTTSADFDAFLTEEGILEEVRAGALKKVATYRKAAARRTPVYLDDDSRRFVERIARKKKMDVSSVVNELIHRDRLLVEAAK